MRSELNWALTRVASVLGCPSFLKRVFYVNKISVLDYYRDSIWLRNRVLYRHFCDVSTDNAHRKLQHVLCNILFCSLRVLAFISLEYSSLQVHILRILVLHYKDTLTDSMSKKLKFWKQTISFMFHKRSYNCLSTPHRAY